jgi:hypothetical protein
MCNYRRGFGLEIGFINHINTRPMNIFNYRAIADFDTLHITTPHVKSFLVCCVFTSRSLVTASNGGDSSASALTAPTKPFLHRLPYNSLSSHFITTLTNFKVKVMLRPTVSRPVCLRIRRPSGA